MKRSPAPGRRQDPERPRCLERFPRRALSVIAAVTCLLASFPALAFPPAPFHLIHGLVRDEYGMPITVYPATIYLETPTGLRVQSKLSGNIEPGTNYRLEVPMDSGLTADLYQPVALKQNVQFRLKLVIGKTTYVPIEMNGSLASIGKPGQQTRLDLTMGVDSDGDGLPDAWEDILISMFGGTLADIRGQDDADGDGISNRDEYLAGTYAFDPSSGFRLTVLGTSGKGTTAMEFLTLRGRTYTIQASPDLRQWSPVGFRIVSGRTPGALQNSYYGADMRTLHIEVPPPSGGDTNRYFRALVQ